MFNLTTSEVAQLLGVTPQHVRRLARRGALAHHETRYGREFPRGEAERFARERERVRARW